VAEVGATPGLCVGGAGGRSVVEAGALLGGFVVKSAMDASVWRVVGAVVFEVVAEDVFEVVAEDVLCIFEGGSAPTVRVLVGSGCNAEAGAGTASFVSAVDEIAAAFKLGNACGFDTRSEPTPGAGATTLFWVVVVVVVGVVNCVTERCSAPFVTFAMGSGDLRKVW